MVQYIVEINNLSTKIVRPGCSPLWYLALLAFIVDPGESIAAETSDVLDAWRNRENSVQTMTLRWDADVYRPSTGEQQEAFSVDGAVVVDDSGRIRVEYYSVSTGRRSEEKEVKLQKVVRAFDGNSQTMLFPNTRNDFPAAYISEGDTRKVSNGLWLSSIFLAYRPLDERFACFSSEILRESGQVEFQGDPCLILDADPHSVWVTNDPRFLLVRLLRRRGKDGLPLSDTRITYKQADHNAELWVPAAWNILRYGGDETHIVESRDATVTDCLINRPLDDSDFEISLPPGTWVQNTIDGSSYILRDGKPNRPVIPGEYTGDNYEHLRNTEPPSLDDDVGPRSWLFWANVIVCITIVAIIFIQRSKNR